MGTIPLSVPVLGGNEAAYLQECVSSGFVSSVGPFVDRFEAAIAEIAGVDRSVAVSTGTAALQLALEVVGAGDGREVWVPDSTFIATANAAVHAGAVPVLVDVTADGLSLDPDLVAGELQARARGEGPLPAAIVPVHLYGEPVPMPWLDLARSHGVAVVEDAAESLGAHWVGGSLDGRHTGTAGVLGCFSFNGNKVVTAGGGGVVVGDAALLDQIRHLSTQARVPGTDYEHDAIGYNHRLTNLCAAVGLAQLEQLDVFVGRRRAVHRHYVEEIRHDLVEVVEWTERSNCWLTVARFTDVTVCERVRAALLADDIQVRGVWPALHRQAPLRGAPLLGSGRHAESWADTALCLPSSADLDDADQGRVIDRLLGSLGA